MPTHNTIILPKRSSLVSFQSKYSIPLSFSLFMPSSPLPPCPPLYCFSLSGSYYFHTPPLALGQTSCLHPSLHPPIHLSILPATSASCPNTHTHTVDLNSVSEVLAPFPKQCPDLNTCTRQKRAAEGGWVTLEAICLFLTFDSVYLCVYVWGGEGCFAVNSRPADFVHKQRTEIRGFNGI